MKRTLWLASGIIGVYIIFAYGFQVTQVNLAELGSPTRQESLARIMRALAHPDFLQFERTEAVVEVPIMAPCPTGAEYKPPAPDVSGPYMVVTPPCAAPGETVTVQGYGFAPNTQGPLNFIPPSGVSLSMGTIQTDSNGYFETDVQTAQPHQPRTAASARDRA